MSQTVDLIHKNKTYHLPLIEGTKGEQAIDISELRSHTGLITFDPGYMSTGSCQSQITYLDGENGILLYRGIPIEQLAEHSNFIETAFLLIYGHLPTSSELEYFQYHVTHHSMIHESIKTFYDAFPQNPHPMAVCSAVVGSLATFYQDQLSVQNEREIEITIHRLLAKLPTIAAYSYKKSIGQPFPYPKNALNYTENFLHMMFSNPCEEYEVSPLAAKALDTLLILHADHEQNCSTSTVRLVGSSRCNLYSSVSAGIYALWGPLHGGANQAVIEMLQTILDDGGDVKKYVDKAKDSGDSFRLMGFGHRVYKNFDPRSRIIKKMAHELFNTMNINEPLLELALELEEIALKDDYFLSRKLYPNVDFYSGLIYKALEIPVKMFPVLFAMGRLPGWIAHWIELQGDKDFKIGRPRQVYTGQDKTEFVPMSKR
ncbi:MAG: citrate synthase [Nitrospinaceae bacterium]|nr:citrate synthase [Nitrospinaceae bacterium]NIR57061.1 citrate synthase [Nitrospinaceae bacterium]NIT84372.1 citrate synthase [Nitrospinaceae bacterium]NIU46559.1 citrate synthase [Nitrospinaceae bacterium]NIU98751.1 citrate synthase [Nitrospinaceae bacterium]